MVDFGSSCRAATELAFNAVVQYFDAKILCFGILGQRFRLDSNVKLLSKQVVIQGTCLSSQIARCRGRPIS